MMRDWSELRVEVEEVKALLVKARLAGKTKKRIIFLDSVGFEPTTANKRFCIIKCKAGALPLRHKPDRISRSNCTNL